MIRIAPPSFKVLGAALLGCLVAAIAVGRMTTPAPTLRSVGPVRFVAVPNLDAEPTDSSTGLLDLATGKLARLTLPEGESLTQPAFAPWVDEAGQGQVAGRWQARTGRAENRLTTEFGLARYSFPAGEPLNRVQADVFPDGAPCWFPGTTAKLLFAASDGMLYRFAFEGSTAPDAGPGGCDPRPVPILWKVAPPGDDERSVRIADPVWPIGLGFGGRVIVSLRLQVRNGRSVTLSPPRLWSLQLDEEGTAIEAAAPLASEVVPSNRAKVRYPKSVRGADGRDQVGFLSTANGRAGWDLLTAPIVLDDDGAPRFASDPSPLVEGQCGFGPPAFSPDGQWVYYSALNPDVAGLCRVATRPDQGADRP